MKKIVALVLAIIAVMSFAACGKKNDETLTEEKTEAFVDSNKDEAEDKEEEEEIEEDDVVADEVATENEAVKGETEAGKEESTEELTLGNTLLAIFNEKAKEGLTAEEIVNEIAQMEILPFALMPMAVEEGYLQGFDEEITGFTNATVFAPMIGSIPFVGYVFETEDADALIETLKANANLRWNICVEAEEMVVGKNSNKVFFVMCPKSAE